MSDLRLDGQQVSVRSVAPGELICDTGASASVRVWVPTRAPALLCEIRSGAAAPCVLEWCAEDGVPRSLVIPASSFNQGSAYVSLSALGETLWSEDERIRDWPRGLGSPAAVPERVRKERTTARDNRLRVVLEGERAIEVLSERLRGALEHVGAWVTKGPDGEPLAVASYGPEGAHPASSTERNILARALLAVGQYEDVNRWSSLGMLDEDTGRARTLWLGGEDEGAGDDLWLVAAAEPDTPTHVAQAITILEVLHGTLGLRPDATFGRAGMAPHCEGLTGFAVEDLRIGTSQCSVTYARASGRHRFEARQTWGVVPIMLVLEPWLPLPSDTPATVDGQPGDPTREAEEGGVRVRLQMPLEAERSLEIGPESPELQSP